MSWGQMCVCQRLLPPRLQQPAVNAGLVQVAQPTKPATFPLFIKKLTGHSLQTIRYQPVMWC